jgi:UDPglucose--hexose-1-phosphate uridylyltransferase
MSELRQNLATREWVIIAPERMKGKPLVSDPNMLMEEMPGYEEKCPFCPANEDRFDNVEIDHIPHPDPSNVSGSPWLVRSIENKYKIFDEYASCPIGPSEFEREGIYNKFMGCGSHELVIESPVHNRTLANMDAHEVEAVVRAYISRFKALKQNPNNLLTVIFKNHGPRSGASQVHPHSQILGMRVVPNYLRFLINEATRYFDEQGVCVFCKIIDHELSDGRRVVYENDHFAAFVPYAATVPYEIQIIPKKHDSIVEDTSDDEIVQFAECLSACMSRLYKALSNPDFNLVMRNPPYPLSGVPFYHWHMQVIPHTKTPGGFERGARMHVNVTLPEECAEHLRSQ